MKAHWHEQIQRFLDGQLGGQDSAALAQALARDPELRLLYLDYANLDAALTSLTRRPDQARLGAASSPGGLRPAAPGWLARHRHWLVPAAACLALILMRVLSETRTHGPKGPDMGTVTSAARKSISHLSPEIPTPIPSWMSPTATLLNEPVYARR